MISQKCLLALLLFHFIPFVFSSLQYSGCKSLVSMHSRPPSLSSATSTSTSAATSASSSHSPNDNNNDNDNDPLHQYLKGTDAPLCPPSTLHTGGFYVLYDEAKEKEKERELDKDKDKDFAPSLRFSRVN